MWYIMQSPLSKSGNRVRRFFKWARQDDSDWQSSVTASRRSSISLLRQRCTAAGRNRTRKNTEQGYSKSKVFLELIIVSKKYLISLKGCDIHFFSSRLPNGVDVWLTTQNKEPFSHPSVWNKNDRNTTETRLAFALQVRVGDCPLDVDRSQ